jgi:hypothetical protein
MGDVVAQELKALVIEQMLDVVPRSGEEVVDAENLATGREQTLAEMGAKESSSAANQHAPFEMLHYPLERSFNYGAAQV